jgi:hypothetical protein
MKLYYITIYTNARKGEIINIKKISTLEELWKSIQQLHQDQVKFCVDEAKCILDFS